MKLEINPRTQVTWYEIGEHGTAVLVADDFLLNAEELRAFALTLAYEVPVNDYYPGVKAVATLAGSSTVVQWVAEKTLRRLFAAERPAVLSTHDLRSTCTFAVLACDRRRLPPNFVDQHVDGRHWIATVLHLSHATEARGTGMWEHRPTGISHWVPADVVQSFRLERLLGLRMHEQLTAALDRAPLYSNDDVEALFAPRPGRRPFSQDEDERWRLLRLIPAKFNRLVAYPTWQLHSVVDGSPQEPLTLDNMRLTMNQFVDYPVPQEIRPDRSRYPREFYGLVDGLIR